MLIIAVAGGIGAGKTVASDYFRTKGAVVLDLDEIAHRLLEPGTAGFDRVIETFGRGIVGADGSIDRAALAQAAFSSPQTAKELNEIVHPPLSREVVPALTDLRLLPDPPVAVVLQVPLLVEAPVFGESADIVLAISAPEDVRVARVVAQGLDEADVRRRLACQASEAERESLADHVIENDGTLEEFHSELERFWSEVVAPSAT